MKARPIPIDWHEGLPIFACEAFLKGVGDEYGWLGGVDHSGKARCILPYTVIKKGFIRMARFRVETIPLIDDFDVQEEKAFLNSVIDFLKSIRVDLVIPATTNTIFRTYPDGADAAPYGSYVIDLSQSEDVLWRNMDRILRQNIKTASKKGVVIRDGGGELDAAYALVRETFKRSKLPFMSYKSFRDFVLGLGENGKVLVAEHEGVAQSYAVFAFSRYCAYAVYAGNVEKLFQGANKLIYWEAIRTFRSLGVHRYDFVGARIAPEKGSKQEALDGFKKRFGAELKRGYMWKYSLHPAKYLIYQLASRVRSGGDIVDAERHKLKEFNESMTGSASEES